ncbi:helix-turn-helix domain-containing protein [Nocardia sp. XZ_19_369]|uniref:helix-turn-helix domain-containing protein n=1 Tax=Nocardia sp. XZ_19_369 TaxID=2769487 RepID=UPI00188F04F0|nr:helix-turn-helix domain-containing protein [Nocardia sp. XZ_19_369]
MTIQDVGLASSGTRAVSAMAVQPRRTPVRRLGERYTPIGHILQRYREEVGLSQEALAERAGLSTSLVSKIESGARSVSSQTISLLAPVLELNDATRERLVWLTDPELRRIKAPRPVPRTPTPRETVVLQANPNPAAYLEPGTGVVVAANTAFTSTFLGLRIGDSVIEWQLLSPWARGVLADWYLETHLRVRSCREALTGFVPNSYIDAMKTRLRQAQEFEDMWHNRVDVDYAGRSVLRLRHPSDDPDDVRRMYVLVSSDDSPWRHLQLVPTQADTLGTSSDDPSITVLTAESARRRPVPACIPMRASS